MAGELTERDIQVTIRGIQNRLVQLKELMELLKKAQEFPLQTKVLLRQELRTLNTRAYHHQQQVLIAYIDIYLDYLEQMKRYTKNLDILDTEIGRWETVRRRVMASPSSQFNLMKMIVEESIEPTSHFLFKVRENTEKLIHQYEENLANFQQEGGPRRLRIA